MNKHEQFARFSVCAALLAGACSSDMQSVEDGTFEPQDDQITFRGTASWGALSSAEKKTYLADRQYVRSLAAPGTAVGINHADPRQHRFALMRLRLAGKTPENSPELFRTMETLKGVHATKGLVAGVAATLATLDGERASQHETLTTGISGATQTMVAGALVSRKEQLVYGYADSCPWDKNGNALGDCQFVEVYGNMPYYTAQSLGDMRLATTPQVEGDSFLSTTVAGTGELQQSYVVAPPQALTAANSLITPIVEHPKDLNNDGVTQICLERNNGGCDYHNMGMWTLQVPLKGSVSVTGTGMIVDWPTILNTYRSAAGPSPGKIYVTLGNNGGGCTLPAAGQGMTMRDFWQNVTVSPAVNPTTMSWDLATNTANWAKFSNNCQLVQATVYLTMELIVPYKNVALGTTGTLGLTITNAPQMRPLPPPNLEFRPALRITNSCLAAGTMVAGADGKARPIEDIHIGDKVFSPYMSSLTVTDTTIGTERTPMVRIRDARGRELLMTEMHPLYVVDRGMVAAKLLKVGDRVKTDDGTSQLVNVTREAYNGQVYNLKVGNAEEARSLGANQTAVYANGFLVGDSQIQSNYELAEQQAQAAAPKKLPLRWRKDYLTSLNRSNTAKN